MSSETYFSTKDPWFVRGVSATAGIFIVVAFIGFILLPYLQPDLKLAGLWDAICSAAGVVQSPSSKAPIAPDFKISTVALTSQTMKGVTAESIGRGATLAQQCAICHGPTGVSRADSPNLAGEYPSVVYKELMDFKTGARVNAVMTPFAAALSEQDMIDLAAYYAYLPRLTAYHPSGAAPPAIVVNGAPMRGIAPCGSCHGALDNKLGSPWLEGQPEAYIRTQLKAFAANDRHNDNGGLMRNIARQMTPEEIDAAARYYASQPAAH